MARKERTRSENGITKCGSFQKDRWNPLAQYQRKTCGAVLGGSYTIQRPQTCPVWTRAAQPALPIPQPGAIRATPTCTDSSIILNEYCATGDIAWAYQHGTGNAYKYRPGYEQP